MYNVDIRFSLQKGKHIETVTAVIDLKNLSEKHLYWPVVDQFKKVGIIVS